jgi:hypothetical protein
MTPSQHSTTRRLASEAALCETGLKQVGAISLAAKISQRLVASAMRLTIRLGLSAAHEEAFLDDLTVADRVEPDLIEVHAFLALGRDL